MKAPVPSSKSPRIALNARFSRVVRRSDLPCASARSANSVSVNPSRIMRFWREMASPEVDSSEKSCKDSIPVDTLISVWTRYLAVPDSQHLPEVLRVPLVSRLHKHPCKPREIVRRLTQFVSQQDRLEAMILGFGYCIKRSMWWRGQISGVVFWGPTWGTIAPFSPLTQGHQRAGSPATTGLPASEPGGSRTHDLRIKSPDVGHRSRGRSAKLCQKLRRYPPTLADASDARIQHFRRLPTPTDARNSLPKQARYRAAPRPVVLLRL